MSGEKIFYHHHNVPVLIRNKTYLFTFCGLVRTGYLFKSSRILIGISACNLTLEKNWNRKKGNELARLRATLKPHRIIKFNDLSNKSLYKIFLMNVDNIILREGLNKNLLQSINLLG